MVRGDDPYCNWQPGFRDAYARAREAWADFYEEKVLAIAFDDKGDYGKAVADHARVQRARLQVDTLKWFMSKWAPRRYGDKVEPAQSTEPLQIRWETIERVIVDPRHTQAEPPEPPRQITWQPGPLPAGIEPELMVRLVNVIRDSVPQAETRPPNEVLDEIYDIIRDALTVHFKRLTAA